jgi:hypothetical protein
MASAFGTGSFSSTGSFGAASGGGGGGTVTAGEVLGLEDAIDGAVTESAATLSAAIDTAISDLIGASPAMFDTLAEINAEIVVQGDFATVLQGRLDGHDAADTAQGVLISALQTAGAAQDTDISALQTTTATQATTLTALASSKADQTALDAANSAHAAYVTSNDAVVAALSGDAGGLQTILDGTNAALLLKADQTEVDTLTATVAANGAAGTTNASNVAALQTTTAAHTTDLAGLASTKSDESRVALLETNVGTAITDLGFTSSTARAALSATDTANAATAAAASAANATAITSASATALSDLTAYATSTNATLATHTSDIALRALDTDLTATTALAAAAATVASVTVVSDGLAAAVTDIGTRALQADLAAQIVNTNLALAEKQTTAASVAATANLQSQVNLRALQTDLDTAVTSQNTVTSGLNTRLTTVETAQAVPVAVADVVGLTAALAAASTNAVDAVVAGAGPALDTLLEFSNALGGDENFATNVAASIATKAPQTALDAAVTNTATNLTAATAALQTDIDTRATSASVTADLATQATAYAAADSTVASNAAAALASGLSVEAGARTTAIAAAITASEASAATLRAAAITSSEAADAVLLAAAVAASEASDATLLAAAITASEGATQTAYEAADAVVAGTVSGFSGAIAGATSDAAAALAAVATEVTDRTAADAAEVVARDAAISTAVAAETTARGTAITSAVAGEATARDTAISAAIATEVTNRDGAIGTAVAALTDGAPEVLNTLGEIATALADNASFSTSVVLKNGSTAMTGALPMGGNTITGLPAPTATGQAARWDEVSTNATNITATINGYQGADAVVAADAAAALTAATAAMTAYVDSEVAGAGGGGGGAAAAYSDIQQSMQSRLGRQFTKYTTPSLCFRVCLSGGANPYLWCVLASSIERREPEKPYTLISTSSVATVPAWSDLKWNHAADTLWACSGATTVYIWNWTGVLGATSITTSSPAHKCAVDAAGNVFIRQTAAISKWSSAGVLLATSPALVSGSVVDMSISEDGQHIYTTVFAAGSTSWQRLDTLTLSSLLNGQANGTYADGVLAANGFIYVMSGDTGNIVVFDEATASNHHTVSGGTLGSTAYNGEEIQSDGEWIYLLNSNLTICNMALQPAIRKARVGSENFASCSFGPGKTVLGVRNSSYFYVWE